MSFEVAVPLSTKAQWIFDILNVPMIGKTRQFVLDDGENALQLTQPWNQGMVRYD